MQQKLVLDDVVLVFSAFLLKYKLLILLERDMKAIYKWQMIIVYVGTMLVN